MSEVIKFNMSKYCTTDYEVQLWIRVMAVQYTETTIAAECGHDADVFAQECARRSDAAVIEFRKRYSK